MEGSTLSHTLIDELAGNAQPTWVQLSQIDDGYCFLRGLERQIECYGEEEEVATIDSFYQRILQKSGLFSHSALLDEISPYTDPIDYLNSLPHSPLPYDEHPVQARHDQWHSLLRALIHRDDKVYQLSSIHLQADRSPMVVVNRWYRPGVLVFAEQTEMMDYHGYEEKEVQEWIDLGNQYLQYLWGDREGVGY